MQRSNTMPWALVLSACLGMFAATSSGSTRAPFLPDMAADLFVSLPAMANLFGVTAACWGISSFVVGRFLTPQNRRLFVIASMAALGVTMLCVTLVNSYWSLVVLLAIGGCCCGSHMTAVLAEVSVKAHSDLHGRAFGYVLSGQSLTLLFGVPLAAWLGASIGWRGNHILLALLASLAAVVLWLVTRAHAGPAGDHDRQNLQTQPRATMRSALPPPIVRLLIALMLERVAFGLAAFYYATYLRDIYGVAIDEVALPLVGFALGNIAGTLLGGQIADRFFYRRVTFGVSVSIAGLIAVPWFLWQPGMLLTAGFGVLFAFFNALGRPPLLAALADVPENARGVVMGLNSTVASAGWLTAALLGGVFYSHLGFGGLGPCMTLMCLLSAVVVFPDRRKARSN